MAGHFRSFTALIVLVACFYATVANDPISVDPGAGGQGALDLSSSDLTTKYCVYSLKACEGGKISTNFASTIDQVMSKCNRELTCLGFFIDVMRDATLQSIRCASNDLTESTSTQYYRLKKGESCPETSMAYEPPPNRYSNSFCMASSFACPGHGIYRDGLAITDYLACLQKCTKIKTCAGVDFQTGVRKPCVPLSYQCQDNEMVNAEGTSNYMRLDKGVETCADNRNPPAPPPTAGPTAAPTEPAVQPAANIALNKPTWQTGIGWDGQSSRGVDGNPDTNYWGLSCTHTDHRNNPYWVVDLGQSYGVTGVAITNRADCCRERLHSYDIVVTDTKPEGDFPHYGFGEICAARRDSHHDRLLLACYSPTNGRYVMIILKHKEYLTLCEVEVYAGPLPTDGIVSDGDPLPTGNVAFRQPTWQTGIGWDGQSSRGVDNNLDTNYWGYSCTHTDHRDNPYWAVDLGSALQVSGVSITNRADCCSDRLKNYIVVATNTRPAGANPAHTTAEICASRQASHSGTLNLQCYQPINARYVFIQLRYKEYLTLCEVGVYAGALPEGTWVKGDTLAPGNIALNQPTWQTGIGWDGQSSRGVDGNADTNYWGHSCTHTDHRNNPYWVVDLGQSYGVTGVSITNRADCCSERLKNYVVVVTDTRPDGAAPAYTSSNVCASRQATHSGTLNLRCYRLTAGRYVMIQLKYQEYLTLCEVKVYAGDLPDGTWVEGDALGSGNLALNRPTWQTGIGWNGQSSRGVDGNADTNYWGHSCTHTDHRNNPYWAVDLGQSVDVTGVSITNRADCCSTRLSNYVVVVTDTRPAGDNPAYAPSNLCATRRQSHVGTLNLECYKPTRGRYLFIQLRYREYLTLCEVGVYSGDLPQGTWIPGDFVPTENVAQGKATWQTGIGWNGQSSRAVDGTADTNYWGHSCTHTDHRNNPYWVVDLGRAYTVKGVSITNREDCCYERLRNYNIVVTNTRPSGAAPVYGDSEICLYRGQAHHGTLDMECARQVSGRYVMIQLKYREYLTLCEVKVFT